MIANGMACPMTLSALEVSTTFATNGSAVEVVPIETGHINDTFFTRDNSDRHYVLQRINSHVFSDAKSLVRNIQLTTDFVRKKLQQAGVPEIERRVLQLVPQRTGDWLAEAPQGQFWRMYRYIERAYSVESEPTLEEIYQSAFGFGEFAASLAGFPAGVLIPTIPDFHHGPMRFRALCNAVDGDVVGRTRLAGEEIDFITRHEGSLARPQKLIERGEVPLRVTHNDTKSNNVLLDSGTHKALCVIDLDTVMPGLVLYDFGDLVRTTACCAAEDEVDLNKIYVEPDRVRQATWGFLAGMQDSLEASERRSLVLGPAYMTLIMATRFLTDFLQGDIYFKTHHPNHNLDRCRAQIAVVRGLQRLEDEIASMIMAPDE